MSDWDTCQPNALDPRRAFPHLAKLFDHAEALALATCWGSITRDDALALLAFARPVRTAPVALKATVRMRLTWCLDDAISQAERDRSKADTAIRKALAPLLDRRAADSELRVAAMTAGACLFAPAELREIIEGEKSWWVRLHVKLDELAPVSQATTREREHA